VQISRIVTRITESFETELLDWSIALTNGREKYLKKGSNKTWDWKERTNESYEIDNEYSEYMVEYWTSLKRIKEEKIEKLKQTVWFDEIEKK
jgi:hypothetical protein